MVKMSNTESRKMVNNLARQQSHLKSIRDLSGKHQMILELKIYVAWKQRFIIYVELISEPSPNITFLVQMQQRSQVTNAKVQFFHSNHQVMESLI